MRILVIIYEFPPVGGGGGQAAKEICLGLAKRGHDFHVLTAHLEGLPHEEELEGIRVFRIPSARRSAYRADLKAMSGFVFAGLVAGLRHVRAWRPDLIHVHFAVPSGPVAWVISRFTHIPYILTAHLGDVPGGVPEKTGRWFRWIYPFTPRIWADAAQVVAVSEYTRELAKRCYPAEIQVIPNGVDLERLNPGEIHVGQPPRIIFAGRFMPQKDPVQLVHTLGSLKHLNWECVMLGDGPLRPTIEREIKDLGLDNRFTLPGWVTPQEVIQWFSKSDILFMPSLSEGLPVVGVQALAMGLSIVAARVGGFVDLVDEGQNGFLIQASDRDRFAHVLERMISDAELLLSYRQASRQKARQFDIRAIAEAYETLFLSVISA